MMEDILGVLDIVGISLEFDSGTIKGIPGFNLSILVKGEVSPYEVEKQNFTFQVATLYCVNFDIIVDSKFTMTDLVYIYTFKVDTNPVSDLTGWSRLLVNYISKELV
jgi:hypothetical protein